MCRDGGVRERVLLALASLLITTEATLLQPIALALGNPAELESTVGAVALALWAPWVASTAGLLVVSQLLALWRPIRVLALAVAVVVAQLVQGHWLVWDYGLLDGSPIDWQATPLRAFVDVALWGGLLIGSQIVAGILAMRAGPVLLGVAVLEIATLAASLAGSESEISPSDATREASTAASAELASFARFSRAGDAILIVLDSLPPDVFAEGLEDPEVAAALPPGFTFFPDALAHHVLTDWSAQTMLSGEPLPLELAGSGQRKHAWIRERLYASPVAVFARAGGDARIATFRPISLACDSLGFPCAPIHDWAPDADVPQAIPKTARARRDANEMLLAGWFRASPQPLKARLYAEGRWTASGLLGEFDGDGLLAATREDLTLLASLEQLAQVDEGAPGFRMLHLFGAHQPPTADASCQPRSSEPRRDATVETTRCLLHRVFALLHRLDALQAYDPATIILASDHGHPSIPVDPTRFGEPELPVAEPVGLAHEKLDRGVPMLLAKRPGARHPLRIDRRPVALCDVATTIGDALRIEHELACPSLFADDSGQERERYHVRRRTLPGGRNARPLLRYRVGSPAWDPSEWTLVE